MQYIIPSPSDLFPGRTARLPQLLPAQIARPAALPSLPRDFSGRKRKAEKTSAWKFSPLSVQGNRRPLFDGDLLHLLRFDGFLFFRNVDGQHAVLHFRVDLIFFDVLRQDHHLLETTVRKFATQVPALLVLVLVFFFFLHRNDQLVIGVDFTEKSSLVIPGAASSTL